jgi:plastocyanin
MNVRFVLAALALASTVACGSSSSPSTPAPTPNPSGPSSAVSIVPGSSVLTTTAYSPNPVTVAVGTTVVWTNNDSTVHTSVANNGAWNSGTINPGGTCSTTFSSAGTFSYYCTLHPNMVGTVTVQ